ncbi:MAG: hypothetical protein IBX60_03760 [Candidatus Aminicenantes bacterium]|nr:hypothetical protein [Candidatus Aminicenantes bacterium]
MDEAEKIFRSIFKSQISLPLRENFDRASKVFTAAYSKEDIDAYNRALEKISDLEALEFASRYRNRLPLLVLKFKLMVYLAETTPENLGFYVNRKDRRLIGYISIAYGGLRSMVKFIKGMFLLRILKNA